MNILKNPKILNVILTVGYLIFLAGFFVGYAEQLGLKNIDMGTLGLFVLPIFGVCSLLLAIYNKRYKLIFPSIILVFSIFVYVSTMSIAP